MSLFDENLAISVLFLISILMNICKKYNSCLSLSLKPDISIAL